MKYDINFLEQHVSEDLYLAAKNLLQVESPKSKKKGKLGIEYVFTAEKSKSYIVITGHICEKASCDCQEYQEDITCKHIVAALIAERSKQKTPKASKPLKKTNKSLSLDAILKNVDSEDILRFLKYYAKRNSKFDLAMKVNFARRVPVEDTEAKYYGLFNKILPDMKGGKSYTIPAVNQYIKHCEELIEQLKDCISLKYYTEAVILLHYLITRTAYAKKFVVREHEKLDSLYNHLHLYTLTLLQHDIAPELREQLIKRILQVIELSYYRNISLTTDLSRYIINLGSKEQRQDLHRTLIEKMEISEVDDQNSVIVQLIINAVSEPKLYNRALHYLKPNNINSILAMMMTENRDELIQDLVVHIETSSHLSSLNLDDFKLYLARQNNDQLTSSKLLIDKFIKTKSKVIFQDLLHYDVITIEKELVNLRNILKEDINNSDLVLQLYDHLSEYELMVSYAIDNNLYSDLRPYMDVIYFFSPEIIDYLFRKYLKKATEDVSFAFQYHVYLNQLADAIPDHKVSIKYIRELREFREQEIDTIL